MNGKHLLISDIKGISWLNKRDLVKFLAVLLTVLTITGIFPTYTERFSFAADNPVQPPVENLIVSPLHNTPPGDIEPPIGIDKSDARTDNSYVDLAWDILKNPEPNVSQNKYINFYVQEFTKPYKPSRQVYLKEKDVAGNTVSLRMKNLLSGTFYSVYTKAYYTYKEGEVNFTSPESVPSNSVKLLTDIQFEVAPYGSNQIKIKWDDVWNGTKRIDYKIYVAESNNFTNTPPMYISSSQIGMGGIATVNEAEGKVEYIYTVRDPGRVYYVKVLPDISEASLVKTNDCDAKAVSSYIIAKTTRMSTTSLGTIWKIDWSSVVTGLADSGIKVYYHIYKGSYTTNDAEKYVASVDDTSFFTTIPKEETNSYYIIYAIVTKNNNDVFPGIKIKSDKIPVKESEEPYIPPTPELVEQFSDKSGNEIISVDKALKSNEAAVLFRVPQNGLGETDVNTGYDIWLIADPNQLDNPPDSEKIAADQKMGAENQVTDGGKIVGYKYKLENLTANSTYYFKMVAVKTFIEIKENQLVPVKYYSKPIVKIIVTRTSGPMDQPVAPAYIKTARTKMPDGKELVSDTEATIILKSIWYEKYNASTVRWEFVKTDKLYDGDTVEYNPVLNPPDNINYRKIEYDEGISFNIGCVLYKDDITLNSLKTMPTSKITGVSVIPNDTDENADLNPDRKKHNVKIRLSGLTPNTTYIIWSKAARAATGLISDISNAIIITTDPQIPEYDEKPTVPSISYISPGDTYAELGWEYKNGYDYIIRYGTKDNPETAEGTTEISSQKLTADRYIRISRLKPNTTYYFWIQAVVKGKGNKNNYSDMSDSFLVKTLPLKPPEIPTGFGLADISDAVTKNSISFEWNKEEGIEYNLEVSVRSDFKDPFMHKVGKAEAFMVDKLTPNTRYYVRLYAYNPDTELKSLPTIAISMKTLTGNDEFDSSGNKEEVLSGNFLTNEFIEPENKSYSYVVKKSASGAKAERFLTQVKKGGKSTFRLNMMEGLNSKQSALIQATQTTKVDYVIDLPVNVLYSISASGISLVLDTGRISIMVLPSVFKNIKNISNQSYEIIITETKIARGTRFYDTGGLPVYPKTNIVELKINLHDNGVYSSLLSLKGGFRITFAYNNENWFGINSTSGYQFNKTNNSWDEKKAGNSYKKTEVAGYAWFDFTIPGKLLMAEKFQDRYSDISTSKFKKSIVALASTFNLRSIPGKYFYPGSNIKAGDASRLILDILDKPYGSDIMKIMSRAGFYPTAFSHDAELTKEAAIFAAVRLYELKKAKTALMPKNYKIAYKDVSSISAIYKNKIGFAAAKGLLPADSRNRLNPGGKFSRGEFASLIYYLLLL